MKRRLGRRGSCDCAQDDGALALRGARRGARRAAPFRCHPARSRRIHPGQQASRRPGAPQFDSLISRPSACWIGRAFIGYKREKIATCSTETGTGCFITIHSTPSLQGGVVSEPM